MDSAVAGEATRYTMGLVMILLGTADTTSADEIVTYT
jgi:hypothetical protein